MADDVDVTAQRLEREMDALLRRRAKAGPRSTGACLWCDADCRDAWQRVEERGHARQNRR